MGWNVAIAVVVIVGVVAHRLHPSNEHQAATRQRPAARGRTPPPARPQDHWHTYLGVNICGQWLTPVPAFEQPVGAPAGTQNAGIHSHGDGLIHTHPFVASEEGNNATLGKYAELRRLERVVGLDRRVDRARRRARPEELEQRRHVPVRASTRARRASSSGRSTARRGPATRPTTTSRTVRRIAIGFLPKGADLGFPPDACSAFANISDQQTSPRS